MSLIHLMEQRRANGGPVSVAVIGAGRFAALFLAQARHSRDLHVAAIVDADLERAHTALALAFWPPAKAVARSVSEAMDNGGTWVGDDVDVLFSGPPPEVLLVADDHPAVAIPHALAALDRKISVVMACIDADALAGPALAARAAKNGATYSLAYGAPPALIAELADWAQICGFKIAAAGMGCKWRPGQEFLTPDTIWTHLQLNAEQAKAQGLDARRSTARLDGSRTALTLTSAANAALLAVPAGGLIVPPCGAHDLPRIFRPESDGGLLTGSGVVEAATAIERDGRPVLGELQDGVFVTFSTPAHHAAMAFSQYGLIIDETGNYAARVRPHRWSGMETAMSLLSVAMRREATGCPRGFAADAVAIAKRELAQGEILDGIGGAAVFGRLISAQDSLTARALPIALAQGACLRRPLKQGEVLTLSDVDLPDGSEQILALRLETVF